MKGSFSVFSLLAILFLCVTTLWAQTGNQGSVEGTVTDPSGALVPGTVLTLTNAQTGIAFTSASNDSGYFRFPIVPVGTYELKAENKSFATLTQKQVEVQVGARVNLPVVLALAGQKEAVVVTGEMPAVETTRSSVSNLVNDRSVVDLPVNGRNFIDFVLLTPGVTRDNRFGDISFAGQRGTLNSLQVDGTDNNNTFFGQTTGRTGSGRAPYQFSQDAVEEFQVNSSSYSAELGHAGGAVINVVTKSGTNAFHGTAFEFYRDKSMNATDPINKINHRPKSPYHYNQFGGNLGGPVLKNRLFFFFDYDGQRNTVANSVILNLPTGFTLSSDPTIANYQQTALNYLQARSASWNRTFNQDVYLSKLDWHISEKHLFDLRWNKQDFNGVGLENSGNQNSSEHTGASNVKTDTITGTLTSTLTSSLINVLRYNYLRDLEPGQANSINPEATVREGGVTVLTIGRNNFSPRFTNIFRNEVSDTVTWVHGRHTLKTGFDYIHDNVGNFFPGLFSGSYTFQSLATFGESLLGVPYTPITGELFKQSFQGAGTAGPTTHPNIWEVAGFAQDEWRVRRLLTLNVGVRYDYENMAQPPITNPSPALAAAGVNTGKIHNDSKNLAPRIGFALSPYQDNRMVLRGGYGFFYGRTPAIMIGTAHSTNGIQVQSRTFNAGSPAASLIPAQYPNNFCGAPPADGSPPTCAAPVAGASNPVIFAFQPNYHQPLVQQGSLGFEYELSKDLSIGVSYLWVHASRLQRTQDINLALPTTTTFIPIAGTTTVLPFQKYTLPRPVAGFDRILEFTSKSFSIYNGLTFTVNKRFSNNVQGLVSYTWGHVIDDVPDATAVVPGTDDGKMLSDALNPRVDRSNGINDQRHRFVLSTVWQVGNYANAMSGVSKAVLGGWELSGIFTAQIGQPYSALIGGGDLNNDGNFSTDRTPGTGRTIYNLPTFISLDPRVTRNVNITERTKLQFIWEAFNVTNRFNVTQVRTTQYNITRPGACGVGVTCLAPTTGLNAFGFPTASGPLGQPGSRIMQLAAKFIF
jgi:Carboxypeptidase regulatory-like domain